MKIKNLLLSLLMIFAINQVRSQSSLTIAEDFLVKDVNGQSYTLFSILDEGKIVVLSFFTTTCGSCNIYTPEIQLSFDDFGCNQNDVYYLGVNWGSNNIGVTDFIAVHAVGFPCASGLEGLGDQVNLQYDIASHITALVVTPDRQIAAQFFGPNDYPTREALNSSLLNAGAQMNNCSVGIDEQIENENHFSNTQITPNPIAQNAILKVFAFKNEIYDISLNNSLGNCVHSFKLNLTEGENLIDLKMENHSQGIYFIQIQNNSGFFHIEKVVKK